MFFFGENMISKIVKSFKELKGKKPLVHCMTNNVITEFTANALLCLGALPVMSYAKEEVEEMASKSDGLLLNIGTLSKEFIDSMILAGVSANKHNVPIVLDPVGVGATKFRLNEVLRIIDSVKIDIIKGNPGEIATLLNYDSKMKGVESGEINICPKDLAKECAKKYNVICSMTGPNDYVSDGNVIYEIPDNGVKILNNVVGTGCTVGALICAFVGVCDNLTACLSGLNVMQLAGEIAYKKSGDNPGTFKVELLNGLYNLNEEYIVRNSKIIEF